jgi:hypothetical protein
MKAHAIRQVAAVLAFAIIISIGAVVVSTHAAHATQHRRAHAAALLPLTKVQAISMSVAAQNGDANPTSVDSVQTTRSTAYQLVWPGAGTVSDSTPVYATTMVGTFSANNALLPPGAPTPTGTILTTVVNAQTGAMMDMNLSNRRPDLAQAGTVVAMQTNRATTTRGKRARAARHHHARHHRS